MEKKIKHLEFIQGIIERMAHNSFLVKGWSVTLVAGVFALTAEATYHHYQLLSLFPILIFWILDSYYLLYERKFRNLYDEVRRKPERRIDFSMKLPDDECACPWMNSLFSSIQLIFYGLLTASTLLIVHLIQ